jgi:fructose-1,6-bisphosphatase
VGSNDKRVRGHTLRKNMGCITIDYTNLMLNDKETKIKITTDEVSEWEQ